MAVLTKTSLKTFYQTGDRPTQAHFEHLIDTMVAIPTAASYPAFLELEAAASATARPVGAVGRRLVETSATTQARDALGITSVAQAILDAASTENGRGALDLGTMAVRTNVSAGDMVATGVSAGTYENPASMVVNAQGLITSVSAGAEGGGAGGTINQGFHAIPFDASFLRPTQTNGCAALAVIQVSASSPNIRALGFDPAADEHAEFSIAMPQSYDNSDVRFIHHWAHPSATSAFGVAWGVRTLALSDGDRIGNNYGTPTIVTDTGGSANTQFMAAETTVSVAGTPLQGDRIFFQVFRDVSDAGDTLTKDAYYCGGQVLINITSAVDT